MPSVKRVVLVSSFNALSMLTPDPNGGVLHESNTPDESKGFAVYAASKTEAERQAWTWVRDHKPKYTFNTDLPCMTVGRIIHLEIFGSMMGWTREVVKGDPTALSVFLEQWYVDVEDVARLCAQMNWFDAVQILSQLRPKNTLILDVPVEDIWDRTDLLPRRRAEELLRTFYGLPGWISIRNSLEKGIESCE
ncbi:hypothetical protein BDV41DRAFT_576447 [Aspergillus transmontanensis]|uniref:Thioester reductase (TE) domain-containing protein n=1 Tax=Aspergillus transmontanensis TaxID=1034304 RepID=A0A5N6VZJ8_9EURO|nr:hypothetical protein BDV41DRAFT_576447 [Aspergillus transmontanensis]